MFKIDKLIKESKKIKKFNIYQILGAKELTTLLKFAGKRDFTIKELTKIKDYLIIKGIIPKDYDTGALLDEV